MSYLLTEVERRATPLESAGRQISTIVRPPPPHHLTAVTSDRDPTQTRTMHRDLLRSLVLLVIVQALAGAAAPAPHPWRPNPRLAWGNAARRGAPVPDDVTNPTRVCRAVRAQLSTSPQPNRAPPPPRGPGEPVAADRRQRTRRDRRSRARGCGGGTRWRRPGQAGSRSSELMLVAQLNIHSLKPNSHT